MNSRSRRDGNARLQQRVCRPGASRFSVALACFSATLLSPGLFAAETVQPGFVLHDEGKSNMTLSGVRSGELCTDIDGTDNVCNTGTRFTVEGSDSCVGTDGKRHPCTRYGYRYDYANATPGTQIECTATRRDPFNRQQKTYTLPIETESGSVFQPEWITYGRVDRRTMLTEVHECTYLGKPLATIEYIISYEPSTDPVSAPTAAQRGNPDIDEPFLPGVPRACNYLTEDLASRWVQTTVLPYEGANEHMPILRSHCAWFGEKDRTKRARMEHKFHLYELFDTENLSQMQLDFHAAFAAGGFAPEAVRTDLGKLTFIFQLADEDRSGISVVTGIQGPPDGAGRPMELLAHYQIRDPNRTHAQRLACLFDLAERSLKLWFDNVDEATNTIRLPEELPEDFRPTCPQ
jgi:hypothetical protein